VLAVYGIGQFWKALCAYVRGWSAIASGCIRLVLFRAASPSAKLLRIRRRPAWRWPVSAALLVGLRSPAVCVYESPAVSALKHHSWNSSFSSSGAASGRAFANVLRAAMRFGWMPLLAFVEPVAAKKPPGDADWGGPGGWQDASGRTAAVALGAGGVASAARCSPIRAISTTKASVGSARRLTLIARSRQSIWANEGSGGRLFRLLQRDQGA